MNRESDSNSQPIVGSFRPSETDDQVDEMSIADSLERILDASVETPSLSQSDQALRSRLVRASQQMAECEFCVSPVLTRLVDVVIGGIPILSSQEYQKMCNVVACTLFDDTGARARLERLWHRLREGS